MSEDELIAKALEDKLLMDIEEYSLLPDHKFSRRFERKMKKQFATPTAKSFEWHGVHIPMGKSVAVALLSVILSVLLMGATFAVYKLWDSFQIRDYGLYSLLNITDFENAPATLEERYELGIDLSKYTATVHIDEDFEYFVEYTGSDSLMTLTFDQSTKETAQNVFLNTENAKISPTEFETDLWKGIYLETFYGEKGVLIDTGDYIVTISGYPFSQDELIKIAKSVKKVE